MYICVEEFVTTDDTVYSEKDTISNEAYAYMQPNERENFELLKTPSRARKIDVKNFN